MSAPLTLIEAARLGLRYAEADLELTIESCCIHTPEGPVRPAPEAEHEQMIVDTEANVAAIAAAIKAAADAVTRELSAVQHHVLEIAAERYQLAATAPPPHGERMKLAKTRAAQAQRTTHSGNAYRFAVEAAALLILEAEAINRQHVALGMAAPARTPGELPE